MTDCTVQPPTVDYKSNANRRRQIYRSCFIGAICARGARKDYSARGSRGKKEETKEEPGGEHKGRTRCSPRIDYNPIRMYIHMHVCLRARRRFASGANKSDQRFRDKSSALEQRKLKHPPGCLSDSFA